MEAPFTEMREAEGEAGFRGESLDSLSVKDCLETEHRVRRRGPGAGASGQEAERR